MVKRTNAPDPTMASVPIEVSPVSELKPRNLDVLRLTEKASEMGKLGGSHNSTSDE